jgi:hypothetical protein
MHREVSLLFSRARQLARGLHLIAGRPARSFTILLSFLLAASVSASSVTYTYDELGRLKLVAYDNGTGTTYTLDAAGNRKSVASSLDTTKPAQPPSAPTGIGISKSQINLSWAKSTDGTGSTLAGYYVYRNGVQVPGSAPASPTPTFNDTGLTEYTNYTYTVAAFDNASPANVSAQSASSAQIRTLDQTPPSVPASLAATAVSQSQINLTWQASVDPSPGSGLAGYHVYRNGAVLTASVGASATTFSDTQVPLPYTQYTYTIVAFDAAGNVSAQSTAASATTLDQTPPSVPQNLSATAVSQSQINLTWSSSTDPTPGSGLKGYYVYRTIGGVTTQLSGIVSPSASPTFQDTTVPLPFTTYTYTVAAVDLAPQPNVSSQSAGASATTLDQTPPSVPLNLSATVVSASQINLTWSASTDPMPGSGIGGYVVFRNGAGLGGSATTSYTDTTVGGGTTYSYTVLAYDNAVPIVNESAQSAAAVVTTPSNVPSVPGSPQPHGKITTQTWTETWTASTGPVAYYVLSETGATTATFTITAPTTSSAQAGGNGLSYSFQVQACNSSNQCSAFSGTTGVTICAGGVCP